jgi:OOP family OmpA-OmpF porin
MSRRIAVARGAVLAAALALTVVPARAQTLYLGGEGGWTLLQNQTLSGAGFPGATERFDSGYAVGARIGYEEGPWRFEFEYAYRHNGADRLTIGGVNVGGLSGSRQSNAFLANLIYEFDLGWPVRPHIGAGIGGAYLKDRISAPGLVVSSNSNTWEIGYQAIGGLRYDLTPNIAVDLDYRYFATTDPTFRTAVTNSAYKTGYSTHNVVASVVYRFGPPAPPPPVAAPPPPPAPAAERRVFLVFFDWDKAVITPDGMRIIEQAASAYRAGAPVQIQVTGYTDRSGSPGYNQRLSERRASAVAEALVRLGVPRNDMIVAGRGENDNRVPTADGVREPQNRRVEIVFP